MSNYDPILRITDGTTIVDFMEPSLGIWLDKWNPKIAKYKKGGSWQDSPLSTGRRLAERKFENVIEKFQLKFTDRNQDALIETMQTLITLLEKASDYGVTDWQNDPVYIEARSGFETNTRYALIHRARIPEIEDLYSQPFIDTLVNWVSMEGISLMLERGHWGADIPGQSTCVKNNGQQNWKYLQWMDETATSLASRVQTIISAANGTDLYAGTGSPVIHKSSDSGESWSVNLSGAPLVGLPRGAVGLANGYVVFVATNIVRTINAGGAWSEVDAGGPWFDVMQTSSGKIIAVGGAIGADPASLLKISFDNGASWNLIGLPEVGVLMSIIEAPDGNLIAGSEKGEVIRSTNDGASWTLINNLNAGTDNYAGLLALYVFSDNKLYGILDGTTIWRSDDSGVTWSQIFATPTDIFFWSITETSINGELYCRASDDPDTAAAGYLYQSIDYGLSWQDTKVTELEGLVAGGSPINNVRQGIYFNTKGVHIGDFESIYRLRQETLSLGKSATCDDGVNVSNKHNFANLTHIKIAERVGEDTIFSDIFPMTSLPTDLFPAVPTLDDALYFGIESIVINSGPFSSLVFNLATSILGLSNIAWEYWTGSIWSALVVQDNTASFTKLDINSVHWVPPSDWTTNTVNLITGYWIRARISGIIIGTAPSQQTDSIYTIVSSGIDIAADQVLGEIPAISRIKITNISDGGGRNNPPNLWSNRILLGLRSHGRGTNFRAYLNASDEQNPVGISVNLGTDTTFINTVFSATGRAVSFDPSAAAAIADIITFDFGPTIAKDFYGKFHIFVRGNMIGGFANEVGIRLKVISGSGGITFTSDTVFFQATGDWELIDLGPIAMPVGGVLKSTDLGDQSQLIIQASSPSGMYVPDLRIYDLILIPTDEWAIDSVDFANTDASIIGRNEDISKSLDIDSITNPKIAIQSLVRTADVNEFVTSIYNSITPSEAILQANARQKLWFLSARASATGTDFQWISEPGVSHSIQVFKNERYLSLRGGK